MGDLFYHRKHRNFPSPPYLPIWNCLFSRMQQGRLINLMVGIPDHLFIRYAHSLWLGGGVYWSSCITNSHLFSMVISRGVSSASREPIVSGCLTSLTPAPNSVFSLRTTLFPSLQNCPVGTFQINTTVQYVGFYCCFDDLAYFQGSFKLPHKSELCVIK